MIRANLRFAASLAVLSAALATPAWAQDAPAQKPAVDEGRITDVVVTARRQEESIQSTPVSVSALGAQMLDQLNFRSVDKLTQLVPNVAISEASGSITGTQPYIRGIGSAEPLLTIDSPVGMYLDGVYLGRQAANNFDLVDPERIEVLRGPQGTLYGRNTTAGAINIITKKPPQEFGAELKAGYGSYNAWFTRASIDTGAWGNSGLSASFAVTHSERDGFVDNPNTPRDRDPGARKTTAAWGKIHGDWGKLTVDVSADWSYSKGQRGPFEIISAYQPAATYFARSPSYGGDPFVVSPQYQDKLPTEYVGQQTAKTYGTAITAAYEVSKALTFKSITAWRGWDSSEPTNYAGNLMGEVIDFTSPTLYSVQRVSPFVAYNQDLRQRQFSEEFQVLGKTDTLSYVLGAYYFNERASELNDNYYTVVLPPAYLAALGYPSAVGDALTGQGIDLIGVNLGQTMAYHTRSESVAGFGQVSWKPMILGQRLELTGGLRYTHDSRSIDETSIPTPQPFAGQLPNPGATPGPSRTGDLSFSNWSYLGSISFQWTPDILTYARFSTGYKSGGFDARAGVDLTTGVTFPFTFKPEKATSYEVGFKSEFLDHRLRLNGSLFRTDYDDLQVPQYAGGNGFIPNANARYQGFELELLAIPIRRVQFDASLGYVDPTYTEFLLADPNTGIVGDYAKQAKFPYVPNWTVHVGAQASHRLDFADLMLRVDYAHTSKRYFHTIDLLNPANDAIADPGQDLLSARISLSDIDLGGGRTKLRVSVYADNLLNDHTRQAGIDFGPSIGIAGVNYGPPRTFGVDATLKF
ncbi:TonB-dependent receptor [Sphingomonas sp. CL5.1]|uniref:TonB-dependent receptor n=1 Tax=Sphingomonas sp. CL5.1 TaxID=2653203 RepID=UPI00158389BC|nr:TonB-dependent receptor [Sphingomonas sp. CL5.1]QKS01413.1 TonB-dependent receptor [Sphingomonas sp. CL5.1]